MSTVQENQFVSLAYELNVDGQIVDKADAEKPLEFIFGMGMLLLDFEKNIDGKKVGDTFEFTLTPEQGYGAVNEAAVVELPKDIFMVDGEVPEGLLEIGNALPMGDSQGNRMMGVVKDVNDTVVTMDFNHPMAGKTLNFTGKVVGLRPSTDEDAARFFAPSGGCGCGSGECDGEKGEGCGEGCGCN